MMSPLSDKTNKKIDIQIFTFSISFTKYAELLISKIIDIPNVQLCPLCCNEKISGQFSNALVR